MGFFNRLIGMGDAGAPFVAPADRKGLFKLVLTDKLIYMIPLNFIYLVFHIPLIAWLIYCFAGIEQQAGKGFGLYSQEVLGWLNIAAIGFIPCSAVIGTGTVGIAKVMRNWARDEHAFIYADFMDSVKKNWKEGLVLGLVSGIIPLILYWYIGFFATNPEQLGMLIIPAVFTAAVLLIWVMSIGTLFVQAVTYDLSIGKIIKNAYIMNIAHFLTGFLLYLAELLPLIICGLVFIKAPELGLLFMAVYYLIIGFSFGWLIKASYANRLCEEFINERAGLPTRIGLRKEQE